MHAAAPATPSRPSREVQTLDEARARIAELEAALDEAMRLIVKRDDRLLAHERRIRDLEKRLEAT